jgi:hypothetical protein
MAAASVAPKVHFTLQLLFTFADGSLMKFWVHMDIKAHRELSELIRVSSSDFAPLVVNFLLDVYRKTEVKQ